MANDLRMLQLNQETLTQYVDELLITILTYEICRENTIWTLNHLIQAQIYKEQLFTWGSKAWRLTGKRVLPAFRSPRPADSRKDSWG